jgi:hypothetical protein
VLPGPSLPELARTALARAAGATISDARPGGSPDTAGQVPIRAASDGSPLLLPGTGSALEQRLTACPEPVAVCVPADAPFSAVRLAGTSQLPGTRPYRRNHRLPRGRTVCRTHRPQPRPRPRQGVPGRGA